MDVEGRAHGKNLITSGFLAIDSFLVFSKIFTAFTLSAVEVSPFGHSAELNALKSMQSTWYQK